MWGCPKVHSKVANPLSRVSIWGSQWWLWDVIPYNICNQTWVELNILSLPFWEINLLKEKTNFKTGGQSGLFRAMSCCSLFLERPNFKADRSKGKDRYFHWNVTLNNPNSPILCAPTEEGVPSRLQFHLCGSLFMIAKSMSFFRLLTHAIWLPHVSKKGKATTFLGHLRGPLMPLSIPNLIQSLNSKQFVSFWIKFIYKIIIKPYYSIIPEDPKGRLGSKIDQGQLHNSVGSQKEIFYKTGLGWA